MLQHYLTVALRSLGRSPVSSLFNALTLALGLACFVAAYAVVAYWGKGDQHFANAERIHVMTMSFTLDGGFTIGTVPQVSEPLARYLRTDFPQLEAVARANVMDRESIVASDRQAVRLFGVAVDPEFLDIFDLPFVAGDSATALSRPRSVVITEEYAAQLFGADQAVGQNLLLANRVETTVTGVISEIAEPSHMGRSLSASLQFDLLASRDVLDTIQEIFVNPNAPPQSENWLNTTSITYVLMPADGSLTPESLRSQLPALVERRVPDAQRGFATFQFGIVPVGDLLAMNALDSVIFLGASDFGLSTVLLLLGAVILGVACVNYANLATARAAGRSREVGLRKAIGARAAQIMAQYVLEAGVLTFAALAAALVVVRLAVPAVDAATGIDLRLVLFSDLGFWLFLAAVIVAVALLAGAYPAFVLSRVRPVTAIRAGRAHVGPRFLSTLLVGAQFAVTSFLLIAVTVMYLQNVELRRTGLGVATDPLVVISNPGQITDVEPETLRAELERLPQVESVTDVAQPPWAGLSVTLIADSPEENAAIRSVIQNVVGFDFFSTLDLTLLAGRVFDRDRDEPLDPSAPRPEDIAPEPRRVVIDRALSEQLGYASPQDAIEELIHLPSRMTSFSGRQFNQSLQIIGVVENKPLSLIGFGSTSSIYQLGSNLRFQVARISAGDVSGALAGIERTWSTLAPNVALRREFLDEIFERSYQSFANVSRILTALAGFAFLISALGLFAMAMLVANRRVQEIGVRKTLGAGTGQMVALLIKSFSAPVIVANLIAWPVAYFAARAYLNVFIDPMALTPLPFVLCLLVTVLIAWLAVGGQTLRAASMKPADVLRHE